jgi:hypothetical protein
MASCEKAVILVKRKAEKGALERGKTFINICEMNRGEGETALIDVALANLSWEKSLRAFGGGGQMERRKALSVELIALCRKLLPRCKSSFTSYNPHMPFYALKTQSV